MMFIKAFILKYVQFAIGNQETCPFYQWQSSMVTFRCACLNATVLAIEH